jgi:hypothetical protein
MVECEFLDAENVGTLSAVDLLLAGVPLERMAILLGHSSVRITEKHYSPWVRERQEQAEADVRRSGRGIRWRY